MCRYYGAILVSILLCISAGMAFTWSEDGDFPEREGPHEKPLPYYMEEDHKGDDRKMESLYTEDWKSNEFEENIVTVEWDNDWDGVLNRQCPKGQAFYRVKSQHSDGREDRLWEFHCRKFDDLSNNCYWTGYVNDWDGPLFSTCAPNALMTGVYSYHDNGREDRRWNFKCCYVSGGRRSIDCHLTGLVNSWDASMDYRAWPGAALTGMFSVHHNHYE